MEDGGTQRDHLQVIERRTGVKPKELVDAPKCPPSCVYIWNIFGELDGCRTSNGFGPNRIGFIDLDAFQRVTGTRLSTWELQAIKRLDRVYLAHWKAQQPPPQT